jgi:hypothetical protein
MGEMAGSNTQQPETIALSITILELLLETGFSCGWLCKIVLSIQNSASLHGMPHVRAGAAGCFLLASQPLALGF